MGGFTDPTLKRHRSRLLRSWPHDLYHLCGYCTHRAKVAYVKRKEE